jgi:hypothetical protein
MSYQNLDLDQSSKYDLIIARDRTLDTVITAQYVDSTGTTQLFDFTFYSGATLQVKSKPESSVIVLEFSTDDGSIELKVGGQFRLYKLDTDLQMRAGDYYYDMYLSNATLPKRAFLTGSFKINQNISQ